MEKSIENGLQILTPNIFVPWNIKPKKLLKIFKEFPFKKFPLNYVKPQYYSIPVLLSANIDCILGIRFDYGRLNQFELFRDNAYYKTNDIKTSYNDFQIKFEIIWGKPHETTEDQTVGFEHHFWRFGNVDIRHGVYERFGIYESTFIRLIKKHHTNFA